MAVLAAVAAVAVAVLAVVTNYATTAPSSWRVLQPPRVWWLVGFLVLVTAGLSYLTARSGDSQRQASTSEQIDAAADLLAQRVRSFWAGQVVTRGIQTPVPVLVAWQWADESVATARAEVNGSPALGTDPPLLPGAGTGTVLSSGLVTRLHNDVYARLHHGRLVLIGAPGAGKTGAMILLLLEALRHRDQAADGDRVRVPVPVWATMGSWNPATTSLRDWIAATMTRDHPYLRAGDFGPDAIDQLLAGGRVALFLDGLDEMPDRVRSRALQRLTVEAAGLRVVVTSRPDEYQAALDDGDGLPYAAVVDLQPVDTATAADYLLQGRTGQRRQQWQQVTSQMGDDPGGVLAQVLTTPLTLSLARASGPDPSWLLNPQITSQQELRDLLWDRLLDQAYPERPQRDHAVRWLSWIAHQMNTQPSGPTRDLAWWHIPTWTPQWHLRLVVGLMGGIPGTV